jgi:hypothetical protein
MSANTIESFFSRDVRAIYVTASQYMSKLLFNFFLSRNWMYSFFNSNPYEFNGCSVSNVHESVTYVLKMSINMISLSCLLWLLLDFNTGAAFCPPRLTPSAAPCWQEGPTEKLLVVPSKHEGPSSCIRRLRSWSIVILVWSWWCLIYIYVRDRFDFVSMFKSIQFSMP